MRQVTDSSGPRPLTPIDSTKVDGWIRALGAALLAAGLCIPYAAQYFGLISGSAAGDGLWDLVEPLVFMWGIPHLLYRKRSSRVRATALLMSGVMFAGYAAAMVVGSYVDDKAAREFIEQSVQYPWGPESA
jgi:hypothetical protein